VSLPRNAKPLKGFPGFYVVDQELHVDVDEVCSSQGWENTPATQQVIVAAAADVGRAKGVPVHLAGETREPDR
jgi:hypothetical protein